MVSAAFPVRIPVETWLESWLDATSDLNHLMDESMIIDESGASIPSQIKIKLSLVSDLVNDNFETFMEGIDTDVSLIVASASVSALGAALKSTKSIIDIVADVCRSRFLLLFFCRSELGACVRE